MPYKTIMHGVVEMPAFIRSAAMAGMTDAERMHAIDLIAADPTAGDLIVGSGGCRKVRVPGRGKGKSGGFRVVTYYYCAEAPVHLLWTFSKGRVGNLTRAQVNDMATVTAALAASLRQPVGG